MANWSSEAAFLQFKESTIDFIFYAASILIPVRLAAYDAAYREYQNHGMPYGDNHAGLIQWLKDMEQAQLYIRRAKARRKIYREELELSTELEAMREYLDEIY